jgi:hypothetical protein
MKFLKEEIIGSQNYKTKRYTLAIGVDEAHILLALLSEAKRYTPQLFETMKIRNSLTNMMKVLSSAIPEFEDIPDYAHIVIPLKRKENQNAKVIEKEGE